MSDEALYRWRDHPTMPPRPASYFVGYWTTMPRPISERDAKAALVRFLRAGDLIQVSEVELLALIAA